MKTIIFITILFILLSCNEQYDYVLIDKQNNIHQITANVNDLENFQALWMEDCDKIENCLFDYFDFSSSFLKFSSVDSNLSQKTLLDALLQVNTSGNIKYIGFFFKNQKDSIIVHGVQIKFELDSLTYGKNIYVFKNSDLQKFPFKLYSITLDKEIVKSILYEIKDIKYEKTYLFREMKREHNYMPKG